MLNWKNNIINFIMRPFVAKELRSLGIEWNEMPRGKTELWNLSTALIYHIYPRLCRFRRMKKHSFPVECKDENEWQEILEKIEEGMTIFILGEYLPCSSDEREKVLEAFKLFGEYLPTMWD